MAANLNRGVERLIHRGLQPTMFNLSAWLSQGIAESNTLRTGDSEKVADAIKHARATAPFVSAILYNSEAFKLTTERDGFILFNEDDFNAYLRDSTMKGADEPEE